MVGGGDVMCIYQLHTLPFKLSKKMNNHLFSFFHAAIIHLALPISCESYECGRQSVVLVKDIVGEAGQGTMGRVIRQGSH